MIVKIRWQKHIEYSPIQLLSRPNFRTVVPDERILYLFYNLGAPSCMDFLRGRGHIMTVVQAAIARSWTKLPTKVELPAMLSNLSLSRLFGSAGAHDDRAPSQKDADVIRSHSPGCLGIMMQAMTPHIAAALGLESTDGVLITNVVPDGPAAKVGLAIGHVITAYANRKVTSVRDFARAVTDTPAGARVDLNVICNGKPKTISVSIGSSTDDPGGTPTGSNAYEHGPLGLSLGALPDTLRRQLGVPQGIVGALVVDVQPECHADDPGIQVGDIVMRIDNTEVHDPADASTAAKEAELEHKSAVAVLINRAGKNRFIGVPLGEAER
jgi:membrane-associated protease RseP (regulator of RpoE activity)